MDIVFTVVDRHSKLKIKIPNQLEDFIFDNIVKSDDIEFRQTYLNKCIDFVNESEPCLKSKIFFLRKVFSTILIYEAEKNGKIDVFFSEDSSPEWLTKISNNIWKSTNDIITDHTSGKMDSYRYALLEVTATLLKLAPTFISGFRKDIIKFSWNYIKLEDNITKQVAYVTTSYFISAYETPAKLACYSSVRCAS